MPYFDHWAKQDGRRVEVLQNWLADAPDVGSTISVADSFLDCHGLRPDGTTSHSTKPASWQVAGYRSDEDGQLVGRTIFVYAGNMGVAQGMYVFIDLAERLIGRRDIGFLFVVRGSDVMRLREDAKTRGLDNVVFHDEIDPTEIPGLYSQCHVGIVGRKLPFNSAPVKSKFVLDFLCGFCPYY